MSRFGDNNFKSDVYENLHWLVGEEPKKQIHFLHIQINELIENGFEYMHPFIVESIQNWDLSTKETLEGLGEVYSTIVAWDLIKEE